MRRTAGWLIGSLAMLLSASAGGSGATFVCKGERIEKGTSTWGYARGSGDRVRIESTTETKGYAVDRGSRWGIESGGSTLAWLSGERVEHFNGATWTHVQTARDFASCPDHVAAALWVLDQKGRLAVSAER